MRVSTLTLGTEPWHYYFLNGFLNFNIVFALALFSLPLTALMEALLQRFNGELSDNRLQVFITFLAVYCS